MNLQQNKIGVFTKKQKVVIAALIVFVIACISVVAFTLISKGEKIANDEIEKYLSELSYQTSYKVNQRVDTNFNTLLLLKNELDIVTNNEKKMLLIIHYIIRQISSAT